MTTLESALAQICRKIEEEEEQHRPLSFREFVLLSSEQPDRVFRNTFQLFYDMVYSHVGVGPDEYPDDPESINYVPLDSKTLFVDGADHPFFADRPFANRFINLIGSFKRGVPQNRIYIFEGPHGCGKSTFLNNLLRKFEQYTRTEEGASYETLWRLDRKALGSVSERETHTILQQLRGLLDDSRLNSQGVPPSGVPAQLGMHLDYLEVPCPSHDHPFLMIPKGYRKELLEGMIEDERVRKKLFYKKTYEWLLKQQPCTICMSLYQTLMDVFRSPLMILDMVYARRYQFNRRLGNGISVFNSGDGLNKENVISNQLLQNQLNSLLKDSNKVQYIYSRYAKTNNGIYALMDIKAHNKERFTNLHGIISEGIHKVGDIEENVNSLFLALMNPEDKVDISEMQSLKDRITYVKVTYVLDFNTEVKIYKDAFGEQIGPHFLPRVLENIAKIIISSRLKTKSEALEEWIGDPQKYAMFCDGNLQLLKMDIYAGIIPAWLTEEDRKNFNAKRRKRIIAESENEGDRGFSGRDSLKIFNEFYSTYYTKKGKPITMAMVSNFFKQFSVAPNWTVPEGFLDSLESLYNYTVLQEVKESLYSYNEERISKEIQNYLFAINFDTGRTEKCAYTGEEIEVTENFFDGFERRILGEYSTREERRSFRVDVHKQYTSTTLTQEMLVQGKRLDETSLYHSLIQRYTYNLKEKVLDPLLKNDNFRNAVKDYATESFKSYDKRIRSDVSLLIRTLKSKFQYTEQGAREVCIYVIDNDIAARFSR